MTTAAANAGAVLCLGGLLLISVRRCGTDLHLCGWVMATAGYGVLTAYNVLKPDLPWVPAAAAFTLFCGWQVWLHWRKRKRRRTAALLGAKARALRDALVRRARDVAVPRGVLVPGGAFLDG